MARSNFSPRAGRTPRPEKRSVAALDLGAGEQRMSEHFTDVPARRRLA
ncbi:MAG: hypothetical protein H0V43_12765 [Gemmatimonadales bacterium]|nr:hypothetical protein [Gemmatimonadales bacterium]